MIKHKDPGNFIRSGLGIFLLLILGSLPCCGGLPNPVVLLTLKEVPGPTAKIDVDVTSAKYPDIGTVTFTRDGNNDYESGGTQSMPSMGSMSADVVQLALDLPAALTGTVQIRVLVEQPEMNTMGVFQVEKVACVATTITGANLYTLPSINVTDPSAACPSS
jgi:hypothetical protein